MWKSRTQNAMAWKNEQWLKNNTAKKRTYTFYTPKNTMARKNPQKKNKNANARSKPRMCKNWNKQTRWPEERTQAKKHHRNKKPYTFWHPKNTTKTKQTPWQDEEAKQKTRTWTCAQNLVRVKFENTKQHGLKHAHRPKKNTETKKTRTRFDSPKNTTNKNKKTMAGGSQNNKNKNVRSKSSACKNWKRRTPWPDARTQTKKQAAKQNKCTFCHSKQHQQTKKQYAKARRRNPKQKSRTRTCAPNLVCVKQKRKHHGLMHGHRPKNKPPNKTNARFVTPKNTTNKKENAMARRWNQKKQQEHKHALKT